MAWRVAAAVIVDGVQLRHQLISVGWRLAETFCKVIGICTQTYHFGIAQSDANVYSGFDLSVKQLDMVAEDCNSVTGVAALGITILIARRRFAAAHGRWFAFCTRA